MKVKYIGKDGKINCGGIKPKNGEILEIKNLEELGNNSCYFQEVKEVKEQKEEIKDKKKKNKKEKK